MIPAGPVNRAADRMSFQSHLALPSGRRLSDDCIIQKFIPSIVTVNQHHTILISSKDGFHYIMARHIVWIPPQWRIFVLLACHCSWFLSSKSDAFLLMGSSSSLSSGTVRKASTVDSMPTSSFSELNSHIDDDELIVVPPNGSFRETTVGAEVSISTMNVLAPSYHVLGEPLEEQSTLAQQDRQNRYPQAIAMAKKTNADILCLQEVEGGLAELEEGLGDILARNDNDMRGYDAFVFSPLLPNRPQDVVGLCVAWRSDRHRLVSCETFRRGMVVQLAEVSTGATIAIANLHLPAKPSAIEGRLRAMASAIRRMQTCEATLLSSRPKSGLDGLAVVVGDFNCDQKSPAVKLLKSGYSTYGTIKDRNYKAKISKRVAANMRHVFRFRDVYDGAWRHEIAPVTVSLHGRGPGIMDHILYSGSGDASRKSVSAMAKKKKSASQSRRQARRERGVNRQTSSTTESPTFSIQRDNRSRVFVSSVLSTVASDDTTRLQLIQGGLPRESEGFYSDHLPVGAIFSSETPEPVETHEQTNDEDEDESDRIESKRNSRNTINTKRQAYDKSLSNRRRHNRVLRSLAEWLLEQGATDMIRDVPLYKWKWLIQSPVKLSKKMRAPDLCCVVGNTLVVMEVTISQNQAEEMYTTKTQKYDDVFEALAQSELVKDSGIQVAPTTMVIVLNEDGKLLEESRKDLMLVMEYCSVANADIEFDNLASRFEEIVLQSN